MGDGIRELMAKGVVISGDDEPVVETGGAEGALAFATWLDYRKADGSVPFDTLAQQFCRAQGWVIRDPGFRRKIRTVPDDIQVQQGEAPEPTGIVKPDEERAVRVSAPMATIIDGNKMTALDPSPRLQREPDPLVGMEPADAWDSSEADEVAEA